MITSEKIIKRVRNAVKEFGTHSFYDKGIDDVMQFDDIISEINKLSFDEALTILLDVKIADKECECFVEWITESIDIIDEKFYTEENDIYAQLFPSKDNQSEFIPVSVVKSDFSYNQVHDQIFGHIQKQYHDQIELLKRKINPAMVRWFEKEIPNMDIQDYNLLLAWIHNLKYSKIN